MIAGVDGCKDKWVAVVESANGDIEIRQPCRFIELFEDPELTLIVIDIPIGLVNKGHRQADLEAKRFLKHRHVCVFPAPTRLILDCATREEACEKSIGVGDKRVNVFQWAICPKVRNIDLVLKQRGSVQERIREGHPEVTFALMNQSTPMLSKKKRAGLDNRLRLLWHYFSDIPTNTSHLEDVLDAYALLWTARRIRLGTERRFPELPEHDPFGLRMEISA